MKKEKTEIFDISYEGAGVGKIGGKIVFVPKSLIGEEVVVDIMNENSTFLRGNIETVLKPSKFRVMPPCPYFTQCGGCDFQHCDYQLEKEIKLNIIKKELNKINYQGEILFCEADKRQGYRNKIKLEVRNKAIGYYKAKSHTFFEIDDCIIAMEGIRKTFPLLKEFLHENGDMKVKNIYINQLGEEIAIVFLFDKKDEKNVQKNIKNIKKLDLFDDFIVYFAFGDVLESDETKLLCLSKNDNFFMMIDGQKIEYDVSAFRQVNDDMAKKLYDYILEQVQGKRVINAYSGQGLLTLLLSKKSKFVYGIEYQKTAHLKAEELKELIDEYKMENLCGKVEDKISGILLRDNINTIILDPAREGCDKVVLNEIAKNKIGQVIYVSCNFSTLVRDLRILSNDYDVISVKIFDMFPCTANLETVVILKHK